jgi:hypothetical protein
MTALFASGEGKAATLKRGTLRPSPCGPLAEDVLLRRDLMNGTLEPKERVPRRVICIGVKTA